MAHMTTKWLLGVSALALASLAGADQASGSGSTAVGNGGGCGGGIGNLQVFGQSGNLICDNVTIAYQANVTIVNGPYSLINPISELASNANLARVIAGLRRGFGPVYSAPFPWFDLSYPTINGSGPASYPIGIGNGSINCSGMPDGNFPYPNCDFSAYQIRTVTTGFDYSLGITAQVWANQMVIPEIRRGINWLQGDLHATFQTSILDQDARFIDTLIGQARTRGLIAPRVAAAPRPTITTATTGAGTEPSNYNVLATTSGSFALGNGWSGWIAGDASRGRVGGSRENFGFRSNSQSGAGGVSYASGETRIGLALQYGNTDNRQDSTADTGNVESLRFGAYAAWAPGPFTLAAAATYGRHSIDSNRLLALPSAARASYHADSVGLGLELSTNADLGFATLTPMAGLVYNSLSTSSFREHGGTFLEIAARGRDIAALKPYAGARLGWDLQIGGGMSLSPELRGRVSYDVLNDRRGFAAQFPADPYDIHFHTGGVQPARLSGLVGAGATLGFAPNASASLNYDAEPRGGAVTHMVSGNLRFAW